MLPKKPAHFLPDKWNTYIAGLPGAHILQTWEWGKVKSEFGWQPHYLLWLQQQGQIELITNKKLEAKNKKQAMTHEAIRLYQTTTIRRN